VRRVRSGLCVARKKPSVRRSWARWQEAKHDDDGRGEDGKKTNAKRRPRWADRTKSVTSSIMKLLPDSWERSAMHQAFRKIWFEDVDAERGDQHATNSFAPV
jgi:hypothetical protein